MLRNAILRSSPTLVRALFFRFPRAGAATMCGMKVPRSHEREAAYRVTTKRKKKVKEKYGEIVLLRTVAVKIQLRLKFSLHNGCCENVFR